MSTLQLIGEYRSLEEEMVKSEVREWGLTDEACEPLSITPESLPVKFAKSASNYLRTTIPMLIIAVSSLALSFIGNYDRETNEHSFLRE